MPERTKTQVLIVGGGPVGLTLAIELGLRGVECVIVECGDGVLRVPRMSSVSARGMEFCRRWGIADKVRDAVWPRNYPSDFVYVSTMIGEELARLRVPSYEERAGKMDYSPEGGAVCPQIYFDPIIAAKAKSVPGVSIRYGIKLESFDQDQAGVRAIVTDMETGTESTLLADYLVGCDGAGSVVRRQLGIELDGPGRIATSVNVFFRSAEFVTLQSGGGARFFRCFDEDGCWAEAIAINSEDLWRLSVFHDNDPDMSGESYLHKIAGRDFSYEVLDVTSWPRRDILAHSYRQNRVFIAGDAAHEMSPTGGAGMHTGMCEAVNLAWKLAAVYDGWGGDQLLASYEAESRPLAEYYVDLSTKTFNAISALPGATEFRDVIADDSGLLRRLSMPEQYRAQICYPDSPICIADGSPPVEGEKLLAPSARPGTRAPHCWLAEGQSTLDLFGTGFVLLRFGLPDLDVEPLRDAADRRSVLFDVVDIDGTEAATVYKQSLVLVRPDGHVAWRGEAVPEDALALVDHVRGA
ncbi:MAG: 2-polyprenyl-6-methoxyphenol hydroxylase [Alphaproteobacteria bacterium]|nr:2-polyprenyl-6-methoxyphenol hydroxylase [Alphaproteobacteria bacterium]